MQQAKKGDKVKIHYHGKLIDGNTFDSSAGREPLEFEIGSGQVIAGFDDGVTGMTIGKKNYKYSCRASLWRKAGANDYGVSYYSIS